LEAETRTAIGPDALHALGELADELLITHPRAVVFGGQLAFQTESFWTRFLHNHVVFALQRLYCRRGVPFVIVPVRID
jgi:hypothetical protein